MSDDKITVVSPTNKSKIVKYKLEEDCVNLRKSGLSYQEIAEELNASGKVPEDDPIDEYVVMRFLKKIPQVTKQLVKEDKKRLLQVVNTNFDILHEINTLFGKTKSLLENMEADAYDKGKLINPYQFKAIVSEMREMLRQMMEIQKEMNDYENVRMFMEIVLETLQKEAPDKLPIIVEKLKMAKGTQWFANLLETKRLTND
ncbi:hypothetical protein E308F_29890 [Moorella sp. E308F]|uniref:hypothetical protein n=1 Tax=Moorella sp. E308F TaxID=2572682 RepID=UPI0010FFC632|nr:hypothetical protein [Moorella sp. E308F]GEA16743.1 hypothetical protein E308F_29890 [Moorella sp. E308F]